MATQTHYKTFLDIGEIDQNRYRNNITLNLFVQTTRDAQILLSPVAEAPILITGGPYYEITLGADHNRVYTLERNGRRLSSSTKRNLLSANVKVPVVINVNTNGSVWVQVAGTDGVTLSARDASPINLRFISFRSLGLVDSQWFYDC